MPGSRPSIQRSSYQRERPSEEPDTVPADVSGGCGIPDCHGSDIGADTGEDHSGGAGIGRQHGTDPGGWGDRHSPEDA